MLEFAVAMGLPAAVALPHLLPLQRVAPTTAGAVWLLALALRALITVGGALFVFVYLPRTGLFHAVADWCLHQVVPLITAHLGLSGHPLAHAAVILPGLALAASLVWLLFGLARGWLALRRTLSRSLGEGPAGSTVIDDAGIVVAATALGRRRIVVSSAALGAMDEEELRASLAHELGHIRRRHRLLILLSSFLAALARPLPGTRAAERELLFNLERDADEYAVRERVDPLALASAICKAALGAPAPASIPLAGRGRTTLRVEYLSNGGPQRAGAALERAMRALAVLLAAIAVLLAATLPSWALASPPSEPSASWTATECSRH